MECITSPALDDTEIISYVEGEADDTVIKHINDCLFCSERANRWTSLQNRLRKKLYRVECPTPMVLGEYNLGLLPAPETLLVAQHVRECPLCRREVSTLQDFLVEPYPLVNLLRTTKILIARLMSGHNGSRVQGNPNFTKIEPVLRGEAKGPLTFQAESVVIVLDIQPISGGAVNILGQVAADNTNEQDQWTGALIEIRQNNDLEFSTIVDDLGTFQSESIMPGVKELRIISRDNSFVIVANFEVLL